MGGKAEFLLPSTASTLPTGQLLDAVSALAEGASAAPEADLITLAEHLVLHGNDAPLRAFLNFALRAPDFATRMLERVFPQVAASLGRGWADDRLSFVDVTIAATRLQDCVRKLGRFELPETGAAAVALIVPSWEQHSLPGTMASDQIRRLGVPTRLLAGLQEPELIAMLQRTRPAALFLSCGSNGSLSRTRHLVDRLREGVNRAVPIVLGGPALTQGLDLAKTCHADHLTNDIRDALKFCGLDLVPQVDERGRVLEDRLITW